MEADRQTKRQADGDEENNEEIWRLTVKRTNFQREQKNEN